MSANDKGGTVDYKALSEAAMARITALEHLLVCYRVGKRPSEMLFQDLERTKTRLETMYGVAPQLGCADG